MGEITLNKIIDKLYQYMRKSNINVDYDVFSYGLNVLSKYLLVLIIVLGFTFVNETYVETLTFLLAFLSLRKYCGGFHFSSNLFCLILSIIASVLIPYLAVTVKIGHLIKYILLLAYLIIFIIIGPQDCSNKRISPAEKKYFKKMGLFVFLIEAFLSIILYDINLAISNTLLLTIILNWISISAAKLQNILIK